LGDIAEIQSGGTPNSDVPEYWNGDICWATLVDTKQKYLLDTERKITEAGLKNSSAKLLPINTIIFSSRATIGDVTISKVPTSTNQGYKNFICSDRVGYEFLYESLKYFASDISSLANGMTFKEISKSEISNFKIPLPPKEIQQKIVDECAAIDNQTQKAAAEIEKAKAEIEDMLKKVLNENFRQEKISNISTVNPSKSEIKSVEDATLVSFVEMASVSEKGAIISKVDKSLSDLRKGSYTYFRDNDIIIAKITPCMENGKCALAKNLKNGIGMGSSEFHVIRTSEIVNSKFLFSLLNRKEVRKEAEKNMTGSSGHRRVPASYYENLKIPVPPISEQEKLVNQIEKLEQIIAKNQAKIDDAPNNKKAIMKNYL
jgi:restriction endonuclease S subunit